MKDIAVSANVLKASKCLPNASFKKCFNGKRVVNGFLIFFLK